MLSHSRIRHRRVPTMRGSRRRRLRWISDRQVRCPRRRSRLPRRHGRCRGAAAASVFRLPRRPRRRCRWRECRFRPVRRDRPQRRARASRPHRSLLLHAAPRRPSGSRQAMHRRHPTPRAARPWVSPDMGAAFPRLDRWVCAAVSRIHQDPTWQQPDARSPHPPSAAGVATAAAPFPMGGRSPSVRIAARISRCSNVPRAARSSSSGGSSARPAAEVSPKREAIRSDRHRVGHGVRW